MPQGLTAGQGYTGSAKFGACVLGTSGNNTAGLGISITVGSKAGTATVEVGKCGPGIKTAAIAGGIKGNAVSNNEVILSEDASGVTVRIMPDRSLADFFVQGGQWSVPAPPPLLGPPGVVDTRQNLDTY